ncbi:trifunctional purine biosynthetic protein adenosine-3-like isoform X2 [Mixophyes fleayi]|uniref:trifunctional purine biosynthetic protein adenosine-3-like isoform X2 n=1 Tax=Mixophyes fleayi TaxID=3061075 RepID=UPI003F4D827E
MPFLHIQKHCVGLNKVPQLISSGSTQLSENISKMIHDEILLKAGDAMKEEGWNYAGLFGAKIMVTEKGPVVLGLKCTFQDLESQIIFPLLKSDLYEVIAAAAEGRLCSQLPVWSLDRPVVNASSRGRGIHSTAYRNNGASPDINHQGRNRCKVLYPNETHEKKESSSDAAQAGSTAMTDVHRSLGRHVSYFEVNTAPYKDPLFVCTTNSIGEKLKVAQACNLHKLAAQGLVTTCINDLLSKGAQTTFFMPYFAYGKLPVDVIGAISEGLAEGCRMSGSTLLERDITQLPGACPDGGYSLFGCALSVMERDHRLPRLEQMRDGDLLIGLPSPGVHSSSLGLLRNILENHSLQYTSILPMSNGVTKCGEVIISSDMVYSPAIRHALQSGHIRACVPVTDGGLVGSILRYLPESLAVIIDALCWKIPAIFSWLYKEGDLSEQGLVCNFNCGLGAVLIAERTAAQKILAQVQSEEEAWLMGSLIQHHSGSPRVRVRHLLEALRLNTFQLLKSVIVNKSPAKISHVAVLISPTGTKLKIMMDAVRQLGGCVRLAVIISNKIAVEELRRAAGAGIPTRVIDHTMFGCQSEFENTICKVLEEFSIDLICIAGFGRTLSKQFLHRWKGKILKLYTSLFPSSKMDELPMTGARVCGCTVCFMLDGCSAGPIILQETVTAGSDVPVSEQMEEAEQRTVVKALHLVASGALSLDVDGHICWKSEN